MLYKMIDKLTSSLSLRIIVVYICTPNYIITSIGYSVPRSTFSILTVPSIYARVSVWPFIKIVAVCWLVIPYFNGASIAYNNIVRPCLSMQLSRIIVDMLNKKQHLSLTRESFLEEAERYVKENGTKALEKLISSKVHYNLLIYGNFCE